MSVTVPVNPTYTETVIKNISGDELYFGFIPPHGRRIDADDTYSFKGDIDDMISAWPSQRRKRFADALEAATEGELVRITRNLRSVVYPLVQNTTVIAVGDLIFYDGTNAAPAADFAWSSDLATTQDNFANQFLGVALEAHASGDGAIRVAVDISPFSLWDFTSNTEIHKLGNMLAPAKDSGNALLSNKLALCTPSVGIARAHRQDSSPTATAFVSITSAFWEGAGPQYA